MRAMSSQESQPPHATGIAAMTASSGIATKKAIVMRIPREFSWSGSCSAACSRALTVSGVAVIVLLSSGIAPNLRFRRLRHRR